MCDDLNLIHSAQGNAQGQREEMRKTEEGNR